MGCVSCGFDPCICAGLPPRPSPFVYCPQCHGDASLCNCPQSSQSSQGLPPIGPSPASVAWNTYVFGAAVKSATGQIEQIESETKANCKPCPDCKGKGKIQLLISTVSCNNCSGTGEIQ